ncbi:MULTISPECIES: iron-responsive transcriptional regulator RirA [Bartonella]|uniref:iron-responsive transcriptional regulator RirA n=1 Tax=Bartonella TaxID=773 RepID=UPI0018DBA892|nr:MULTISPECIES: iron-responsive transcriptional regulator RirA [Bartonella]MBH9975231.1 iron-responsive transcriptional regulator RirA [Bartonella choladocola]MBI0014837.1 iron-responsive transcriptional regulator RirA [Bartonella sp. B10834G3]MBI0140414.1 iron-responsive transcriptional regulator RirA [Bartonella choladocola]
MRLTKQTNYAIRMLMYCAANEGELSRVPEIAKAYSVSELFLFKILHPLVEAGLMQTVRGRNGGVKLAKPADEIFVSDVVKVTEENFAMAECFENGAIECPLVNSCGLNATLSKALNAFFDVLKSTSIADLQRPNFRERLGITEGEEHVKALN